MPEAGPELPRVEEILGEEEHRDRYGRLIAVATVVTTLIAALVAFAQIGALRKHDVSDARAETYGAQALASSAISRGTAETQLDRLQLLTEQVRQEGNAELFDTYGGGSTATRLTAARWKAIAVEPPP